MTDQIDWEKVQEQDGSFCLRINGHDYGGFPEELLDQILRDHRHRQSNTLLERADHPTTENGQCPVCYSEGYVAGEAAAKVKASG